MKIFDRIGRWWCRKFHMEQWKLVEHGKRKCATCKRHWHRNSSASNANRNRLPR